jgi:hypothetical protein
LGNVPSDGGTLLQIHYHNRPGGVATVMLRYMNAFARRRRRGRGPHANLIVCRVAAENETLPGDGRFVDVKDCDYRSFRHRAGFCAAKKRIMRALASIIDSGELPRPIIVVGHNLTLGKNCALSSAFADTARRCTPRRGDVRFFSVVHDFAEEGRTDLLCGIQAVQDFGVAIWNDLYPVSPNLRFVSPLSRNYSLLKKARLPAALLRNPVVRPMSKKGLGGRLRTAMREIAKEENMRLDPSRPVMLYPSRVISRKNPVEAVLVAYVMLKSNLLLGAAGASAPDSSLEAGLKALCRNFNVPAVFDAGRIAQRIAPRSDPFSMLYGIADLCITTSIAEGFGYAIHEPALCGKRVIGRFPEGLPVSEKRKFPDLYKQLLIPCAWVRMDALKRRYYDRLADVPGWKGKLPSPGSFSRTFDAAFTRERGIDFGSLDLPTQFSVLRRCIQFPEAAEEWKQAFPAQTQRLLASFYPKRGASAGGEPAVAFEKSFTQCYFGKQRFVRPRVSPDPQAMLRHFCRLKYFRPLMTPRRVDQEAPCTVFA